MTESLLKVEDLSKAFGGLVATNQLSLEIGAGEIHAVIGPNGAGKTTFIAQLSGALQSDSGTIWFDGVDITNFSTARRARQGLARSFQITSIFKDFTVEDNVALAVQAHAGHSFRFWRDAGGDPALRRPAREALDRIGLIDRCDIIAGALAHGEQRQLEVAMALATKPSLLLLDEPAAGMGVRETGAMVTLLEGLKGDVAILLVEHDMDTVFALADRISVLVGGAVIATGTPARIRDDPAVQQAYLGEDG